MTPETLLSQAHWVHRLARALLRDRDLADDVAQEALLAALSRPPGRDVQDPRGWLQTVIRRLAGLAVRERRARTIREQGSSRPEVDHGEERSSERLRLYRHLCDAVLALPEPYRTAVSKRFFDDLAPRSIARELGVDAAVVRQRVSRGLAMLRERFDRAPGGRREWLAAFAVSGLGSAAPGSLFLAQVIAMKKVAVAAILLLAAGVWWLCSSGPASVDTTPGSQDGARELTGAMAAKAPDPAAAMAEASTAAPQRTAVEFVVHVVDQDGHPLRGAAVHCWRETGDVVEQRTDADGRCSLVPTDEAGGLLVVRAGFVPVAQELPSLRGSHEVVLGRGSMVAGTVLVDGVTAPPGLSLKLSLSPVPAPPSAPRAIVKLWRAHGIGLSTVTDTAGRFLFAGLPGDWSGYLLLPPTHWLLPREGQFGEGDDRIILPAPQRDLLVATTRLPVLHGRVIWSDGGEPVPGVTVLVSQIALMDGTKVPSLGARTDTAGRFHVAIYPSSPDQRGRWLEPLRRSGVTYAKLQACGSSLVLASGGSALDLSSACELRVERPPLVWFRAVDPDGRPIAGARAPQRDSGIGEPSGEDGIGWTYDHLRPLAFRSLVGAPGRQVVPFAPAPATTRNDPVTVVLPPANGLRLRVRSDGGGVPGGCSVKWRGAELYEGGQMGGPSELHRFFGTSDTYTPLGGWFRCDDRGEVVLHSIRPGITGALVVSDAMGTELLAHDLTTPEPGEVRDVELVVNKPARRVHGRVIDGDGMPVAQAHVILSAGNAPPTSMRSARDGSFVFGSVYSDAKLKLQARRPGSAVAMRDLAAEDMHREVVLTLGPGRRTTVVIVDDTGAVIPQLRPEVRTGSYERVAMQRTERGEFLCFDLPQGEVTFACVMGGQRFELRHDTANPRAELRLPRPARAEIAAPEGWPRPESGRLVAVATRTDVAAEPLPVELAVAGADPLLFVPGRYRITLSLHAWRSDSKRNELVEQGPSAEVELRAGATTRVQLR